MPEVDFQGITSFLLFVSKNLYIGFDDGNEGNEKGNESFPDLKHHLFIGEFEMDRKRRRCFEETKRTNFCIAVVSFVGAFPLDSTPTIERIFLKSRSSGVKRNCSLKTAEGSATVAVKCQGTRCKSGTVAPL